MCVVVIKVGGTGSSTPSQLRTNLAFFLKIQRKRKEEQVESSLEGGNKGRGDLLSNGVSKRQKVEKGGEDEKDVELEDFEVGASPFCEQEGGNADLLSS
jgi:hypothetical protein